MCAPDNYICVKNKYLKCEMFDCKHMWFSLYQFSLIFQKQIWRKITNAETENLDKEENTDQAKIQDGPDQKREQNNNKNMTKTIIRTKNMEQKRIETTKLR